MNAWTRLRLKSARALNPSEHLLGPLGGSCELPAHRSDLRQQVVDFLVCHDTKPHADGCPIPERGQGCRKATTRLRLGTSPIACLGAEHEGATVARKNPQPNVTLYNLRDLKSATQEEVADALQQLASERQRPVGVTGNDVSRWERGISRPGAFYRQLLAEYYQVTVEELGPTQQRPAPIHSSAHLSGPGVQFLDLADNADLPPEVADSQEQWLTIRQAMHGRQPALARLAAQLYPEEVRIDDTGMLTRPGWTPDQPCALEDIEISLDSKTSDPAVNGQGDELSGVLPLAATASRTPATATPFGNSTDRRCSRTGPVGASPGPRSATLAAK